MLLLKAGSHDPSFITNIFFFVLVPSLSLSDSVFLYLICQWHLVLSWYIYLITNSKSTAMSWSSHFKIPHTFFSCVTALNEKHGVKCATISRANISLPAYHGTMSRGWMWFNILDTPHLNMNSIGFLMKVNLVFSLQKWEHFLKMCGKIESKYIQLDCMYYLLKS